MSIFLKNFMVFAFFTVTLGQMAGQAKPLHETPFEKDNNYSTSYEEAIAYYKSLAKVSHLIAVNEFGSTDSGKPLHEVIISSNNHFSPEEVRSADKTVILINNAIHAGEPCGIDASMLIARDLISGSADLLDRITIVIIPVYNIGGALNRGSYSRANQNGPDAYGFRGNAKNLDLNRDFIKTDSKNALSFNKLFNKWNPDILIDNHTSNGADYQYVITLIATQKDKLNPILSKYMTEEMLPYLYRKMEATDYEMIPYVNVRSTPDEGISGFLDLPRYSSGYATLHNTISFMPETHMLKPYKDRVYSTYHFMESMLDFVRAHSSELLKNRALAIEATKSLEAFDLNWELDREAVGELTFKGYEAKYEKSAISGMDRLYYDRSAPYTKNVPFYNTYKATLTIDAPKSYIIPQGYSEIIERLAINGVIMDTIKEDEVMELAAYRIEDYVTARNPYEGHFLHREVKVSKANEKVKVYSGDIIIHINQAKNRYIVETLEPQGPDSWFAWNFFDGILGRKEYFSAYVFEDLALTLLNKDSELKKAFEEKKATDEEFAKNSYAQLNFIYENSPYYEKTFKRYPVFRVE